MPLTILHIDDDPDARAILHAAFSQRGHHCFSADSIGGGIALAGHLRPNVIVTEFLIPARTGTFVCEALHAVPATTGIPLVVLSADVMPDTVARIVRAGALFLPKPTAIRDLVAAIESLAPTAGMEKPKPRMLRC